MKVKGSPLKVAALLLDVTQGCLVRVFCFSAAPRRRLPDPQGVRPVSGSLWFFLFLSPLHFDVALVCLPLPDQVHWANIPRAAENSS